MAILDKTKRGWWKKAVFYQIYPKSFQDTNGDGIGDLQGIIKHLDYLERLGIDGIWLCPVFASPQADNGYDISDYCMIDPMFGTMHDMEMLIAQAKKRGISIIMDLVLNHSSNEHWWFREALRSRNNPYHDYYVWRDGTPDAPPNDMQAVFGGSAWTYVPRLKQYYFHQFLEQQPDLNWENKAMRRELYQAIRFWKDKGVEGFRLDVIDQIAKEPDQKITANGPRLHEFLQELSREAFASEGLVTVGETWSADIERAKRFSAEDGSELSMVFQFEHICLDQQGEKWDTIPLSLPRLKDCVRRWQQGLHDAGWNSLFLNNHDLPRIVSRWGDDKKYRVESAKMLGIMLHGLQGTPYIYQGEELGMTNIKMDIASYIDPEIHNMYRARMGQGIAESEIMQSIWARGRDNARTPMQWDNSLHAGFSVEQPWLPVNPNYKTINAAQALDDPNSIFYCYQKLIALRKQYEIFQMGDFTLLCPEDTKVFAYVRRWKQQSLCVICNFTGEQTAFDCPEEFRGAQTLLTNYAGESEVLRPYEAKMLYCEA